MVKIAEIVGINQDSIGESRNFIDQTHKKQLKKCRAVTKKTRAE